MATTNINVRVDTELKRSAEELFSDLGLNMTTAITMFLKTAVACDGIPFEVKRRTANTAKNTPAEYDETDNESDDDYEQYNTFNELISGMFSDTSV